MAGSSTSTPTWSGATSRPRRCQALARRANAAGDAVKPGPYEHRHHPLLSRRRFIRRAARHVALGALIVAVAVSIGSIGYATWGHLPWLDAFLNASMILGGMGPVDR